MSGVYIKGLGMPKEPDEMIEIAIFGDGKVIQTGESWRNLENGKCYYTPTTPEKLFNAVPIPPHGRLGDLDRLEQMFADIDNATYSGFDGTEPFYSAEDAAQIIRLAPTIIQAEEGT